MGKKKRREIPVYDQPIIETHCHLDYLRNQTVEETVAQALSRGIERMITITVSPDNLATVRQLARDHERVYGVQGIHPHEAESWHEGLVPEIRDAVTDPDGKMVAIGEIGLDYFYDTSDRHAQHRAFEQQLALASELDQPVVIHSREADDDTIAILRNFESSLKRRGVIHSFTSGEGLARYALDQGWFIGFNGICTFKKAENVRDIVRLVPVDRLLLETDSPFLTPDPYRGKENAPCYLPFVAEKLAELKGITTEEFLPIVYRNSQRLFFPQEL